MSPELLPGTPFLSNPYSKPNFRFSPSQVQNPSRWMSTSVTPLAEASSLQGSWEFLRAFLSSDVPERGHRWQQFLRNQEWIWLTFSCSKPTAIRIWWVIIPGPLKTRNGSRCDESEGTLEYWSIFWSKAQKITSQEVFKKRLLSGLGAGRQVIWGDLSETRACLCQPLGLCIRSESRWSVDLADGQSRHVL